MGLCQQPRTLMKNKRKIIQISPFWLEKTNPSTAVLCDDGTIWVTQMSYSGYEWCWTKINIDEVTTNE
jgi:hypothetical protein